MAPQSGTYTTPKWILGLTIPLVIFTTLAVAIRVYCRGFKVRTFGWDDWFILPAYVFFVALCSTCTATTDVYLHGDPLGVVPELSILVLCSSIFYALSSTFVKLSAGCYFLRIVGKRWERYAIIFIVSVYVLFGVAACFMAVFNRGHLTTDNSLAENCMSWEHITKPLAYLSTSLNSAADCVFVLVSLPVVFKLRRMPIKNVLCICMLIILATITSLISIVRIHYIPSSTTMKNLFVFRNQTFTTLSYVEIGFAIITASLATLHPLFQSCLGRRTRQIRPPPRQRRESDIPDREKFLAPIIEVEEVEEDSVVRRSSAPWTSKRIGILPTILSPTTDSTSSSTLRSPTTERSNSGVSAMVERSQV